MVCDLSIPSCPQNKQKIFLYFIDEVFLYFEDMNDIDKSHFLFPIKEPFRAEQIDKELKKYSDSQCC
jgi:hypothetical protein